MLFLSLTTLFLFSWNPVVNAGSQVHGEPCSLGDNRLQAGTYQFYSDCSNTNYCASNSTCLPKGCRKDDFPFGYAQDATNIPDKCPRGQFCPDEMDACQDLLPVGSACQLNRDDECEAPPNFKELADDSVRGLNHNGSVCINNVCQWANVTLGDVCEVENTAYIAYGSDGEFINIVSRGNCRIGMYCDSADKHCKTNKLLGEACDADKECDSINCLSSGVCGASEATPRHFGVYVYVLVGLAIIIGMVGTLVGLFFLHRRNRDQQREKRVQYWREQNAFHQNLLQMRETARASILSLPNNENRDSTYSRDGNTSTGTYDSHTPMMQNSQSKGSGLKYTQDDGSEYDEGLVMRQSERGTGGGGRF